MPVFMCIVRVHRVRNEFEVSCTGDVKLEKAAKASIKEKKGAIKPFH